jgi:Holliday junction resolvase YEN1
MRKLNDIIDISNMTERGKYVSTAQSDSDKDALPPPKQTTTRQKKAVLELQATALAPRPFPMSGFISTSADPFIEPTNPIHPHMSQQSSQTCSEKHTKSSDSESLQLPVTKSPRKTPQRTSLRSSGLIARANSPSLVRPIHKFDDIIDISSDSDVPLPPTKISVVAPLLLARAKAKKGDSVSHVKSKRPGLESTFKGQSTRVVMAENDIIDLTD